MGVFDFAFTVRAPLAAVAQFHSDSHALKRLTPPPLFVKFHRVDPLSEGAIADFTLWFGPLPIRWVALHTHVDALHGFTDTQIRGPMQRWVQTHHFSESGDGIVLVTEHVEYEHPPGIRGWFTRLLFNPLGLLGTFCYRRWVTRRTLEKR